MSASKSPVLAPLAWRASARFAATVDLPTPPLPEDTRMMFLIPETCAPCFPITLEVILI
ncbi:hypothetical protein D3C81_875140 [compost metagenome]